MSRYVFKRAIDWNDLDKKPGHWIPVTHSDQKRSAIISCPKCGSVCSITKWDFSENGEVNPSVHHDQPDCGFHEFITLEGWPDKDIPNPKAGDASPDQASAPAAALPAEEGQQ